MTAFGWKRKSGGNISKIVPKAFAKDVAEDDSDSAKNEKRIKLAIFEDPLRKSSRLKDEGSILAENGRFWEAIKKWDEALTMTPSDGKLYEMKAQALLQLSEVFPAVEAAEKAVKLSPLWWIAYQTLGRAQLGIGELKMAVSSFSKALHINPASDELWDEDLNWTLKLISKKKEIEASKMKPPVLEVVYDENGYIVEQENDNRLDENNLSKTKDI